MTKSLRNRTIAVAAVLVLVVAGVMVTLLIAISRQRDSANQARHSQQVISAASQTDTALLATHPIPESVLRAQIAAAFATATVQAVKVGMLATGASGTSRYRSSCWRSTRCGKPPSVTMSAIASMSPSASVTRTMTSSS